MTAGIVQRNYFIISKLLTRKGLIRTKRVKTALHDCLETIEETLYDLDKAKDYLKDYPSNKKPLYQYADDLKTVISSAITNQITCLDGFSHKKAEKLFRKYLEAGQVHVEHSCSNALAMTKNLTDT
ncbi:pectinesterase inhibitor domain-containing protein, partial [Escherichia coli]|nr:pectinesterase inhibitor domain-containing protein [Escherichia coli]